jgi:hypothetical protein
MPQKFNFCSKTPLFTALILCIGLSAFAQNGTSQGNNYAYHDINNYKTFLDNTAAANTAVLDKKIQKEYSKIIADKNTGLLKQLNENGFLFDDRAYPYLRAIFDQILEKNSLDKSRFHFFVDRSPEVNAYSYEDGTVVCNLGLVSLMENESQVAMIFCHELGHCLLKHSNNAIIKQLEKYNSPEFIAKVKAIKRQNYNVNKQLEGLLITDFFDRTKHTRSQEWAADSMGMVLFRNTKYSGKYVARLFDLLDSSENKTTVCTIHAFFKNEKIDLDAGWFSQAKRMRFGTPKKETIDSLKTHPDCSTRKTVMQASFDRQPKTGVDFLLGGPQILTDVRKVALFDEAAYAKEKENYAYYLYQLIQNNTTFPADSSIKTSIFDALVSICKNQKSHTLYKILPSPYNTDDEQDEYAKLLHLLDNINLKSMIEITDIYYTNNKPLISASKETTTDFNNLK